MNSISPAWLRDFDAAMIRYFLINHADAGMDEAVLLRYADLPPKPLPFSLAKIMSCSEWTWTGWRLRAESLYIAAPRTRSGRVFVTGVFREHPIHGGLAVEFGGVDARDVRRVLCAQQHAELSGWFTRLAYPREPDTSPPSDRPRYGVIWQDDVGALRIGISMQPWE